MGDRDAYRRMVGSRVRETRVKAGIGLSEMARYLGIDPSVLTRIERGQISVTAERLEAIASRCKCSAAAFLPRRPTRKTG